MALATDLDGNVLLAKCYEQSFEIRRGRPVDHPTHDHHFAARNVPSLGPSGQSRCSLIVTEQAPSRERRPNASSAWSALGGIDQFVGQPLVVALAVIMLQEFVDGAAEMGFSDRNDSVEALLLD